MNKFGTKQLAFTLAEDGQSPLLNATNYGEYATTMTKKSSKLERMSGSFGKPQDGYSNHSERSEESSVSKFTRKIDPSPKPSPSERVRKAAFTLAEVLITLGIIGVVMAITLPGFISSYQSKVRAEQIRSVKYKFTKATTQMATQDKIGPYKNTEEFVNELKNYLKISKICKSDNLRACWPYDEIQLSDGNVIDVNLDMKNGKAFKMDDGYLTDNVGIITADGTPMILSYNTKCEPMDSSRTYTWITSDNKPVTNETTNCVAGIFEINGKKAPNKFGVVINDKGKAESTVNTDVISFNANGLGSACNLKLDGECYGALFTPKALSKDECEEIADLGYGNNRDWCGGVAYDYWAGAVKQCGGIDKLPQPEHLAKVVKIVYDYDMSNNPKTNRSGMGRTGDKTFPTPPFYIWVGIETDKTHANYRTYFNSSSYYGTGYNYDGLQATRASSEVQAMCIN